MAEADRRCLVAIVHNWPVLFRATAQSLMELGWGNRVEVAKEHHGFAEIAFAWYSGSPRVDALRDQAGADAVAGGFSHLLFLDADMVWPTDVLDRMLAHHDRGIVSGFYTLKSPPYTPVALTNGVRTEGSVVTTYEHDVDAALDDRPDLRPQQVVGMGCTLIPTSIFAQLGARPWFAYGIDDEGWPMVSEDVAFCEKARSAGVSVWLDPLVRCGHVTTQIVDHRWHQQTQALVRGTMIGAITQSPGDEVI